MDTRYVSWCKVIHHKAKLLLFFIRNNDGRDRSDVSVTGAIEDTLRETFPSYYWPNVIQAVSDVPITKHGEYNQRDVSVTGAIEDTLRETFPSYYWPDVIQAVSDVPITKHGEYNQRDVSVTGAIEDTLRKTFSVILLA